MTLPVGKEQNFEGIIDVMAHEKTIWAPEMTQVSLSQDEVNSIDALWEHDQELCAELSDEHMHRYLNGERFSDEEIRQGLRLLSLNGEIVPVVCGSAFKNKGIEVLLDAIVDYLPSPLEAKSQVGHWNQDSVVLHADDEKPFAGLLFKIVSDKQGRQISFIRGYQGMLKSNSNIGGASRGRAFVWDAL